MQLFKPTGVVGDLAVKGGRNDRGFHFHERGGRGFRQLSAFVEAVRKRSPIEGRGERAGIARIRRRRGFTGIDRAGIARAGINRRFRLLTGSNKR